MSWLSGIVGKAEDLLNQVDQSAAQALHKNQSQTISSRIGETFVSSDVTSFPLKISPLKNYQMQPNYVSPQTNKQVTSYSQQSATKVSSSPSKQAPKKNNNDDDEKLLEFLNSSETISVPMKKSVNKQSPSASTIIDKQEVTTQDVVENVESDNIRQEKIDTVSLSSAQNEVQETEEPTNKPVKMEALKDEIPVTTEIISEVSLENVNRCKQNDEMNEPAVPNLQKENELLKNEKISLNQEIANMSQRNKDAEAEMKRMQRKLDHWNSQVSGSDHLIRELQERETDLNNSLSAKDSQLAVLRVRLQEADQDLQIKKNLIEQLRKDNERLFQDHNNSNGLHSQILESLKEKLQETEMALQREKDAYKSAQAENIQRLSRLEDEQQKLVESVTASQKSLAEEKAHNKDLTNQLKFTSINLETLKREFTDYKQKAQRILQSKEKLIMSLKDVQSICREPGDGSETNDFPMANIEMEELQQECDALKDELQHANKNIEHLQSELQEMERLAQSDVETCHDQLKSLEEQYQQEKQQRLALEQECAQQREELRYMREDLTRTKTSLQSRIQDREIEIEKLRKQLTAKSLSTTSQSELEARLHALTESLIQKQTVVEALSTEKSSLVLQLERLEQQLRDINASGLNRQSTVVGIGGAENALSNEKYRSTNLFVESPYDGTFARRVKKVYGVIDSFSVRLGLFLRHYPMARIFVIVYMFLLHLWVMIVLLTYTPEVHGSRYNSEKT